MYFKKEAPDPTLKESIGTEPGGGEMVERIRAFDWSQTALGPLDRWPQSLRTAINILLSSRYAMWMAWGRELTMLYNDAYRPTLGIKHPMALGKPASEVWAEIWPDIGPRIESVYSTGRATYDEGLLLFVQRSGFPEETYHTFSYSPLADDEGQISGMLCVVTEETERFIGERRAETLRDVGSALASTNMEEEVLQTLANRLGSNNKDLPFTLIYLFDEGGNARLACSSGISGEHPLAAKNIEAGSDFPWPAREIFQHPASQLMDDLSGQRQQAPLPSGAWNRPVERAAVVPIKQQGQESPAGFLIVGINPYRRYDLAYSGFVDLLAGQIAAALGNARAHEAERRSAEALAEIDRAKTTFFSNVSHELRTPLTLLLSPVEELLSHTNTSRDRNLLDLVHRNALRLQKLVNTLLDFSRIEAGRMQALFEPVELCRFTEDLASNFGSAMETAGLTFKVQCEELPEPVYVDREMWEKIVLNLISNALKFTLRGTVSVTLKQVGQQVELAVRDTGIGIPKNEIPHIFERFHRVEGSQGRTIEGTGIGLALVQELVKLHGGSVRVDSEVNLGSTFTVSIPLGTAHPPRGASSGQPQLLSTALGSDTFIEEALGWLPLPKHGGAGLDGNAAEVPSGTDSVLPHVRRKILLADDNADMRAYLQRLLSDRYTVVAVPDGNAALAAAAAESPDLILSDVMMPGLNGFDLVKALRANPETSTIPVILLSARAGEESKIEGLTGGADDYLVKPFTARELFARIGAHLSMRESRQAAEAALKESQRILRRSNDELRRANSDLEQFAYSASHDLQEPLRQVSIYSQLLEKKFGDRLDGKGLEYLNFCVEGARRMEMLIGDLLAYTQSTNHAEDAPSLVNTEDVVAEVQKNLATTIRESGAVISTAGLPVLRGDPVPFTLLFQNLISNALKYHGKNPPRVTISAKNQGSSWLFSVQDNGIGIPKEFQDQIFGIFKRLHNRKTYPGTGIGLAICQKVVERYGGRIWVESEVGQGSTFFFTLPSAEIGEMET